MRHVCVMQPHSLGVWKPQGSNVHHNSWELAAVRNNFQLAHSKIGTKKRISLLTESFLRAGRKPLTSRKMKWNKNIIYMERFSHRRMKKLK